MRRWNTRLRTGFLLGAFIDGLAAVVMLSPAIEAHLWGWPAERLDPAYRFAMAFGAALMVGWTVLLGWAARRPVERRAVAMLTAIPVVGGLMLAEIAAVAQGVIASERALPLLLLQVGFIVGLTRLYSGAERAAAAVGAAPSGSPAATGRSA